MTFSTLKKLAMAALVTVSVSFAGAQETTKRHHKKTAQSQTHKTKKTHSKGHSAAVEYMKAGKKSKVAGKSKNQKRNVASTHSKKAKKKTHKKTAKKKKRY